MSERQQCPGTLTLEHVHRDRVYRCQRVARHFYHATTIEIGGAFIQMQWWPDLHVTFEDVARPTGTRDPRKGIQRMRELQRQGMTPAEAREAWQAEQAARCTATNDDTGEQCWKPQGHEGTHQDSESLEP